MKMKILFDDSRTRAEEHAQKTVRFIQKKEFSPHDGHPILRGIAVHQAIYPIFCDDCGETYWMNDMWRAHIGCKANRRETGFR